MMSENRQPALTARRLKVAAALDAAELLKVAVPEGTPRIVLRVALPDRTATADVATKSVRRAQATIREAGADNVALLLQGHLIANDVIAEAGLVAQPKTPKAPVQAPRPSNDAEQASSLLIEQTGRPKGDGFAELRASARARAEERRSAK
jgi:hypothetical protein